MRTPKLTRAQRRRLRKLVNPIDRITLADLNYFARFPDRRYRVEPHCAGGEFQTAQAEGDCNMTEYTMPKQVFDALKVILNELGDCDYRSSLEWHVNVGDPGEGRQVLRALDLVEAWSNNPVMTPDDIRDSFKASDQQWEELTKECKAA